MTTPWKWLSLTALLTVSAPLQAADITVPEGFDITVFHPGVGKARHMVAAPDGSLFVRLGSDDDEPGILHLRDTDGDHAADDTVHILRDEGGTGIEIQDGHLIFSTDRAVKSVPLDDTAAVRTVIAGFPDQNQHAAKSLALDPEGSAFVNVGAPSNACQKATRTPGSPGMDPCPQLDRQAGIWRFPLNASDQTQAEDATRYVTGLRNAVALSWHPVAGRLFLVQHGRDQLHSLWSDIYSTEENAKLPAEEFHGVSAGTDLGWPFSYYDGEADNRRQAPEYGGDGIELSRNTYPEPLVAFPAHWAPNDLLFYTGDQFPSEYRNAAFIAFHGSWNRAPLPQAGFNVAVVPMNEGGAVTGEWRIFADGFAGAENLASPAQASYRPTGLALGPDGSLYIAESRKGRIWKVRYTGNR